MTTQPKALRLADVLYNYGYKDTDQAAAELRRLHEVNQELLEALETAVRQINHNVMMTAKELRQCESAIAKARSAS